jgi:UDP-N-acetylmuramate dehydrogenase
MQTARPYTEHQAMNQVRVRLAEIKIWRQHDRALRLCTAVTTFRKFSITSFMIDLKESQNLKPFNTFHIGAKANLLGTVATEVEATDLFRSDIYKKNRALILGSGSNVLFTKDFDGLVILNGLKGITVVNENDDYVIIRSASGELWHPFVLHCVRNNWGGVENLSLIPGTMGAAPMQNIGAYGVEIKEVLVSVDAIDRVTGNIRSFSAEECRLGYRESVFKSELKENYFISSVTLRLTKKNHRLNTSYGAIKDTLKTMNVNDATIKSISDAVISIRKSKLPDPEVIGNAGSFFKNPIVTVDQYNELKKSYPTIPGYFSENQSVKVPAAWLIEQDGWKGKKFGDAGVHEHQALVLVNYRDAKGDELYSLAKKIQSSVNARFNILLTPEVNII